MGKENLKINVAEGQRELVILHGEAEKKFYPKKIELSGLTVDAIYEYLKKPHEDELIEQSYVVFSYDKKSIELKYGARVDNTDTIAAEVRLNPDLEKFQINSGERMTPFSLADFIRMRRHFFENKDVAMVLEKELRNFTANVDKKIEASDDKRANVKASIVQSVTTNIPLEFFVLLPVFVGGEKVKVKVEVDICATTLGCMLMSPDLKEIIDTEVKELIDRQIKMIKEDFPGLRVFQF